MFRLPDVALTTIVKVPAGVPVTGGGVVELLPPPQPGNARTAATVPSKEKRRALPLTFDQVISGNETAASNTERTIMGPLLLKGVLTKPELGAGCEFEWAVVEMVSVTAVVPFTVTEAEGENEHVA